MDSSRPLLPQAASHSAQEIQEHQAPYTNPGQKVYIIDCACCGMFLSNRGMKAVLLLRPHISLFSTDALPVNCSAYASPSNPRLCDPDQPLPRTCSCLTQTLLCHGCGNPVGYMIVIPCDLCNSSTSSNHRATNNHRFVFTVALVQTSERKYVADDPQVLKTPTHKEHSVASVIYHSGPSQTQSTPLFVSMANPGIRPPLPTPPPDEQDETRDISPSPSSTLVSDQILLTREHEVSSPMVIRLPNSTFESRRFSVMQHQRSSDVSKLNEGDTLYWYHLVRSGEIPACVDDRRARGMPVS